MIHSEKYLLEMVSNSIIRHLFLSMIHQNRRTEACLCGAERSRTHLIARIGHNSLFAVCAFSTSRNREFLISKVRDGKVLCVGHELGHKTTSASARGAGSAVSSSPRRVGRGCGTSGDLDRSSLAKASEESGQDRSCSSGAEPPVNTASTVGTGPRCSLSVVPAGHRESELEDEEE